MSLPSLDALIELVRDAGAAILQVYETEFDVETKSDNSPVTKADLDAHRVLARGLAGLTPDIPLLSEESEPPDISVRRQWQRYWLVDPLDGTKEFVSRNGEFTVNVALIEAGRPILGIVGVPTQDTVYTGDVMTGQAFKYMPGQQRQQLKGRRYRDGASMVVVASRNHGGERLEHYLEALAARFGKLDRQSVGSSLKLCILAEGRADIYPRLGLTSEWDIAAAQAVLCAAGGDVFTTTGAAIEFNKADTFLNPDFIAVADSSFPWRDQLPAAPT